MNGIGIAIRSDAGTFKSFNDVLTELSGKWKGLNDVQRAEASTAIAGTYQRNKFLTLMENMNQATELQQVQMNSAGNAMDRYGIYAQSTEAKINDLKNAQEQMWMKFLNSDVINSAISGITNVVKIIEFLGTDALQSTLKVAALSTVLIMLIKNSGNVMFFLSGLGKAFLGTATMADVMGASFTGIALAWGKLKAAMTTLFLTPQGLAFMAIVTAVGLATAGIIKHIQAQKELADQTQKNVQSYKDLTQAMNENNNEQIKSNATDLQNQQKKLQDLLQQKKSAEEEAKALAKSGQYVGGSSTGQMSSDLTNLTSYTDKQITDLKKTLTDAGYTIDDTTGKIVELQVAQSRISTNEAIDKINKETEATINHHNEIIGLINEYNQLSNAESLNATQKTRLSQISQQLSGEINGLILVKDAEGNVTIQNTNLLSHEIGVRNDDINTVKTGASVQLQAAKNSAQAQIGQTTVTYAQIMQRIKFYQAEMEALNSLSDAHGNTMDALIQKEQDGSISPEEQNTLNNMARWSVYEGSRASASLGELQRAKAEIDAAFNTGMNANFGGGGNIASNTSNSNYTPPGGSDSSKSSEQKVEDLKLETDRYINLNSVLEDVNNSLDKNKSLQDTVTGKQKIQLLDQEIGLLKQKQSALSNISAEQQKEKSELENALKSNGFQITQNGLIENYQSRLQDLVNYANSASGDEKKNRQETVKDIEDKIKNYMDLVHKTMADTTKEYQQTSNDIKTIENQKFDVFKDVQDKMTEILKKQLEVREEAIDKQKDAEIKSIEEVKNAYDKQNQEDDYNKNVAKERQTLLELQSLVEDAQRNSTQAGKARLENLLKQVKDQQDKIDQMVLEHQRQANDDNLDAQKQAIEDKADAEKKALEDQFSDEQIAKIVKNALSTGYFTDINGKLTSMKDAYIEFEDKFGEGMTALGDKVKNEFIPKLEEAQEVMRNMGDISQSLGFTNYGSVDTGAYSTPVDLASSINTEGVSYTLAQLSPSYNIATPSVAMPDTTSKNNVVNFNQPFVVVNGDVDKDSMDEFKDKVNWAVEKVQSIIKQLSYA